MSQLVGELEGYKRRVVQLENDNRQIGELEGYKRRVVQLENDNRGLQS
jgi:hypothetical protein